MEQINIAELLKDCPTGMELDCTMFDNANFIGIENYDKPICIRIGNGDLYFHLTKFGTWNFDKNAKCVIFPKGKTTWDGFVPPKDKLIEDLGEYKVNYAQKVLEEHLVNFDEAEKEKSEFVGDGFIECHADFLDFKEGNTYWLEYIGDDNYNVRSDNLLGKTYHITPGQLYTIFKKLTWIEKQGDKRLIEKATEWLKNTIDEDVLVKCGNVIKCIDANDFSEYFYKAMLEK